uniref:Mucroporin-like peptide n=1 Tax=Lychas mucronatus TaxID=172552 RepID=NDB4S_LYCMC|nr:RecName: Full=Mucroporin-like peptide; AltName: Full=NDBP13; Flags: Precursor [Lychas mucronatus]ABY26705.1 NDBP13 [Lychas mucronatus]
MKVKCLLAVFLIVLIAAEHCQALFFLPSLIGGLISAFKGRRKRELGTQFQPRQKNFMRREVDLERLFAEMPDY